MSNSSSILAYSLTTLVGLGGILQGAEEDTAALTRRIERLEKQNAALKASYVQARSDADKAAAQLVDIRTRLEALGGAALGNSEERLIQAVADIEASNDRIQRLEQASVKLSGAILAYMKQAISEDANARTAVESSLRLLESVLGYRQQPVRDGAGTLAEAKVLSIDSESGANAVSRKTWLKAFPPPAGCWASCATAWGAISAETAPPAWWRRNLPQYLRKAAWRIFRSV